jgi:hypothetical protein
MKSFKKSKIDFYDKKLFDNYNIEQEKTYNYFGETKNIKQSEVIKFLGELGDNKKEVNDKVFRYIIKVIKLMLSKYNLRHFWLTIRTMLPTDKYKYPRWHIDGLYYKSERRQFKFVSVPKGDVTLFIEPSEANRNKFIELEKERNRAYIVENNKILNFNELNVKYGKMFNELFKDEKIVKVKNNYYVEFNVRDKEIGAIHSEPDMKEPRLFFSILPGTKEEIEELKNKKTVG